ncbi:MAG: protein-export chaperone SecB [Betaproteobacteria bacterium]|nr:protein-export chaperone SecB [Betaproteobacteria bacterium]
MSDEQAVFSIEKIYVKDLSLEVPNAPQVFLAPEEPRLDVQLTHTAQALEAPLYEVTITVTVTAKAGERTVFLAEAAQAGIFQIRNVPESDLDPVLAIVCPSVLFPYARETISDIVNRAGFPPVLLAPVNFEVLYQQRLAEQKASQIEIAH